MSSYNHRVFCSIGVCQVVGICVDCLLLYIGDLVDVDNCCIGFVVVVVVGVVDSLVVDCNCIVVVGLERVCCKQLGLVHCCYHWMMDHCISHRIVHHLHYHYRSSWLDIVVGVVDGIVVGVDIVVGLGIVGVELVLGLVVLLGRLVNDHQMLQNYFQERNRNMQLEI